MRGNLIGFFILCGDAVGLEVLNIAKTDMLIRQPTYMPQLSTCPATWGIDHLHNVTRLEAVKPFKDAEIGDGIKASPPYTLSH